MMQLPIGRQDPTYTKAVVDFSVDAIQGDDAPPGQKPAPQQTQVVTPPPAPTEPLSTETAA